MQQDVQRGGLRAADLNSQDQPLSLWPCVVFKDQSLPFLSVSALTLVGTCWPALSYLTSPFRADHQLPAVTGLVPPAQGEHLSEWGPGRLDPFPLTGHW